MRRFLASSTVGVCLLAMLISCAQPRKTTMADKKIIPPPPRHVPNPPPATETRAVWISDTTKLDWDSATRNLQRAGFNAMYVNLLSGGAALYNRSKVLPSVVEGNADMVARGIELAHQRGLTVHGKQIVMFSFKSPPEFQRHLLKNDLVMRGADGKPIVQSGVYWLCPSQPTNRVTAVNAMTEMLSRFPVDGLQFDYLRFNEEPSCFCKHCREEFEKVSGTHVRRWPVDVMTGDLVAKFNDWRMSVITDWTRELSTRARQIRPGIKVSAAVFPVLDRAREEKAQDWKTWLDRGYLDYICPMNYTTDSKDFEARSRSVLTYAARNRVVMGVAGWKFFQAEDMTPQIELSRRLGTAGFAIFSYDDAAERKVLPNLVVR